MPTKVKKPVSVDKLHSFLETTTRKVKVKKIKSKESKEVQHLFENIAKDLIVANFGECKNDLEIFCRGLINKVFSELRNEINSIESASIARISQVEAKISAATARLDTVVTEQNLKVAKLQEDQTRYNAEYKEALETERAKRQSLTKKMQSSDEKQAEDFKRLFLANKQEQNEVTVQLTNEINSQAKEVSKIKDSIEEMLMKRYGFIPGTRSSSENMTASFNQGLDAGLVLDNLTNRIKELEITISCEREKNIRHAEAPPPLPVYRSQLGNGAGYNNNNNNSLNHNNGMLPNGVLNKKLEETVYDLRTQLRECEVEMQGLKSVVKNFIKKHENSVETTNHRAEINAMINESFEKHETAVVDAQEIRSLQKKVKKLAENTTRACRSLSSGLSDVQQATLNLYSWSDKAHDAIGSISNKLSYNVNLCPRAKVYNPPRELPDQYTF